MSIRFSSIVSFLGAVVIQNNFLLSISVSLIILCGCFLNGTGLVELTRMLLFVLFYVAMPFFSVISAPHILFLKFLRYSYCKDSHSRQILKFPPLWFLAPILGCPICEIQSDFPPCPVKYTISDQNYSFNNLVTDVRSSQNLSIYGFFNCLAGWCIYCYYLYDVTIAIVTSNLQSSNINILFVK